MFELFNSITCVDSCKKMDKNILMFDEIIIFNFNIFFYCIIVEICYKIVIKKLNFIIQNNNIMYMYMYNVCNVYTEKCLILILQQFIVYS